MELQWDSLAVYDETRASSIALADSITGSPDAKTWTVKLKPGIMWSDGTPITSKDVLFTWKPSGANPQPVRQLRPRGATSSASRNGIDGKDFSKDISGITAPDDNTVVFQLMNPDGAFT